MAMTTSGCSGDVLNIERLPKALQLLWENVVKAEEDLRTICGLECDIDDDIEERRNQEDDPDQIAIMNAFIKADVDFKKEWYARYPDLEIQYGYHDKENKGERSDEVNGLFVLVQAYTPKPSALPLMQKGIIERRFWTEFG